MAPVLCEECFNEVDDLTNQVLMFIVAVDKNCFKVYLMSAHVGPREVVFD